MSEDLNNKLRPSTDDNVWLILKAVQDLTFRAGMSEQKFEDFAEKLDRRLNDTDAILQKVVLDIAQLHEGQRRLEEGQDGLRFDLTAFRRHVDQQFLKLSGTVEGRYREHDKRIARLEANANQPNSET